MRWPHVYILQLRPEEPQITAGVDRAGRHAGRLQCLDGAVDREALGDAVERKGARATVEKPVAREPHFLGPLEHAPRPRIQAGVPSGAQARRGARGARRACGPARRRAMSLVLSWALVARCTRSMARKARSTARTAASPA